ncbi:MAG: uracil-DNA glycosylase [archaeon]|nr:uracil-DNA glycosylase [archaeon]
MIVPDNNCSKCNLCRERTNIVLPCGDLKAKVVLVGEAPGESEDFRGIPFVGKSGQILDSAMAAAGLKRSDVMITNTVKCRPPKNRDPTEEEMSACRQFLNSELEYCSMIVGLGRSAVMDLIGYEGNLWKIANKKMNIVIDGREKVFLPTYHPMSCVYRKESEVKLIEAMMIVKAFMEQ